MVDIWLIFNLVVPFVEVLLQTYIEYLRGKVEDSQTINHHGKSLQVEDGKVITVSEVGEGQSVGITPLEIDQSHANQKEYDENLFNIDEKIQREALKSYYERRSLYIHLDIFSTEGKVHQEK